MSEKTLNNIRNEAGKLRASGFPFHANLLLDAVDTGKNVASTVERVAFMLERGKRYGEAKRLRDCVKRTTVSV
mgnify:CR=1 FL=1